MLFRSEEEDFREDFRITNSCYGEVMQTRLEKDGRVLEFETNLSQEKARNLQNGQQLGRSSTAKARGWRARERLEKQRSNQRYHRKIHPVTVPLGLSDSRCATAAEQ